MTTEQGLLLYAQNLIRNNKNSLPNAPWVKGAVEAIMSGDATKGAEIANNLCSSFGVSREDAVRQSMQEFNIKL